MHVIGHDDRGLEIDSLPVVVQAMRQNEIARRVGEGIANEFTESHENGMTRLLVMWHAPPIFVFACKDGRVGHDLWKARTSPAVGDARTSKLFTFRVGRTLLSAAFDFDFDLTLTLTCLPLLFDLALLLQPLGKIKINPNVKTGGQECPPYTRPRINPANHPALPPLAPKWSMYL